jgi:hypothetical protein
MTIKQQGGIFGRNPTFNDVTVQGDVEVDGQLGVKTSSHWDASTGITAAGRIHTSDGTATGGLNYGNGTAINMGSMSSHPVQMIVGNSTKAIFETDGDLKLVSGNLIINTSGQGIDFSATSGTGTSELFSDYEEGVWTPTVISLTVVGTPTYTGRYTKVGRLVSFDLQIYSTTSTAATYGATVFSLPFVQVGEPRSYGSCSAGSPSTAAILTSYIYPPTWGATQYVWISGTYSV